MTVRGHDLDPLTVNADVRGRGHPTHPNFAATEPAEVSGPKYTTSEESGGTTVSRRIVDVIETAGDTL